MKPRLFNISGNNITIKSEDNIRINNCELSGLMLIGANSYINAGGFIRSYVEIGRYTSIGRNCFIGLGYHDTSLISTSPYFSQTYEKLGVSNSAPLASFNPKRRVIIGNDVWIGDGVYIKSGVRISDGCIIGANCVVTKDTKPYEIVGGVPGKFIRFRFEEQIIKKLTEIQWWNYKGDEVIKWIEFNYGQINKMLENYQDFLQTVSDIKYTTYHISGK